MTKKTIFAVITVIIATRGALAACLPNKSASTYNAIFGRVAYWHSPFGESGGDTALIGRSWQLGAGLSTWDSEGGAVPCRFETPLYFSLGGINLNLNLGSCGAGCPANGSTLAVLVEHRATALNEAAFLVATAAETPAEGVDFDYSSQGDHDLVEIPRPRVISDSELPGQAVLNLLFSPLGGLYGPDAASAVTGYRALSAQSATHPGHDAASYPVVLGSFPAPGGGPTTGTVRLDCTNPQSQWVVTQVVFEGGAILTDVVSDPVRVTCDPSLAHPRYNFPKKTDAPLDRSGVQ